MLDGYSQLRIERSLYDFVSSRLYQGALSAEGFMIILQNENEINLRYLCYSIMLSKSSKIFREDRSVSYIKKINIDKL